MKLFTLLGLLAVCMFATTGVSQQQRVKDNEIKCEVNELEKNFGIKFKALKLQQVSIDQGMGDTPITITLEFTKDLEATRPSTGRIDRGVDTLRNFFAGKSGGLGFEDVQLRCYFFDEDGVAFTKQLPGKIEGEVSGKTGDAFRITQSVPADVLAKTKKISFREEPVEKKK